MARKHNMHLYDRMTIREGISLNIDTLITGVAILDDMHDELPDWSPDKERVVWIADNNREWLLNKAKQERFFRSVGILATLDAEKLEELVTEKRAEAAESAA